MALKTVFIFSACMIFVLGAVTETNAQQQTDQNRRSYSRNNGLESGSDIRSQIPGANEAGAVSNSINNGMQDIAERLRDAFNQTYEEQRKSIGDSFNSVKDRMRQNIDTAGNLTKTAYDFGTIFPRFGRNFITRNQN